MGRYNPFFVRTQPDSTPYEHSIVGHLRLSLLFYAEPVSSTLAVRSLEPDV